MEASTTTSYPNTAPFATLGFGGQTMWCLNRRLLSARERKGKPRSPVKLWSPLLIHGRVIFHDVVNPFATHSPDVAQDRRKPPHLRSGLESTLSRILGNKTELGAKYRQIHQVRVLCGCAGHVFRSPLLPLFVTRCWATLVPSDSSCGVDRGPASRLHDTGPLIPGFHSCDCLECHWKFPRQDSFSNPTLTMDESNKPNCTATPQNYL